MSHTSSNTRARRSNAVSSSAASANAPKTTTKLSKQAVLLVNELQVLDKRVHGLVSSFALSTSSDISAKDLALWTGSTTSSPQILISQECWNNGPPDITKIILSTLDAIQQKKTDPAISFVTYRKGGSDEDADPRLAIAQLSEPNATNPAAILGLDLIPEGSFEASLALSEFVEPFDQSQQSILLTPKFWNTDLHLGMVSSLIMFQSF
jgi:hypothetical protein